MVPEQARSLDRSSTSQMRTVSSEITKIAKRIEDVSAASAISRADFYGVMTEMGRVVDLVVEDGEMRQRIHDGWMEIRLA